MNTVYTILRHFVKLFVISIIISSVQCFDYDFTYIIPPGQRECFHQPVKADNTLDFEFQVIEGGALDINFMLRSPTNKVLASDIRKNEGGHEVQTTETGDYLFCFDNTFSRMSHKVVYFEVVVDSEDYEFERANWEGDLLADQLIDIKLEDMQESLSMVKKHLKDAQAHQRVWRNVEFRDRFMVERNFERVNFWSLVNTVIMLITGVIQVVMIRSLFGDTRAVKT
ncbi:transmembrane emp24 domain-containing protein 5-like [Saccoglossus kowalevskii]|uniref:Transmembrane emp24 domain-containing protein 5-like n=1 Tax=Saccoglossus kowalevskii TaxID=10224 RepID=A0ABM0H0S8_SACKO|nr:PREDICTED: transmembrane emp24 domain-containing protein 5-like [Saccoglossus kowalevskii]